MPFDIDYIKGHFSFDHQIFRNREWSFCNQKTDAAQRSKIRKAGQIAVTLNAAMVHLRCLAKLYGNINDKARERIRECCPENRDIPGWQ
jgi:hypothetical protein